jgi:hypothetical protein
MNNNRINLSSKISTVLVTSIHNYFNKLENEIGLSLNLNQYVALDSSWILYDTLYVVNDPKTTRMDMIKNNITSSVISSIKQNIYKDVTDSKTLYQVLTILDDYVLDNLTQVINDDLVYFIEQNDNEIMTVLNNRCTYPVRRYHRRLNTAELIGEVPF